MKYCPNCNYAISIIELDHFRFNTNVVECPKCNKAKLSTFQTKEEKDVDDINQYLQNIKKSIELKEKYAEKQKNNKTGT